MITKNYVIRYTSENQRETAKQRFVKNDSPKLIGEDKEGGMSLYQIDSTEITFMDGENAELGIEVRASTEEGIKSLLKILETENHLGNKLEEENQW